MLESKFGGVSIETAENLEQEKGKNVKVSAIFERHGEKEASQITAETRLTETGEMEGAEFGKKLPKRKNIKGYSSDTGSKPGDEGRTVKTTMLAVENSPTEIKSSKVRIRKELGFYCDENTDFFRRMKQINIDVSEMDFGDLLEEELDDRRLVEVRNQQADYYLSFGENRPSPRTISPVDLAALMAKRIDAYINMVDRLNSGSDVQLINGTHDFNIVAFLKQAMILGRNKVGEPIKFEKIEEIGGGIGYNEYFEVLVETDGVGTKTIKLIFRGKEYELDTKRVGELLEIADKFDYESVEEIKK